MHHPGAKTLARTIPASQQVGKQSFYLTEIGRLVPNKLAYFSPLPPGFMDAGAEKAKKGP